MEQNEWMLVEKLSQKPTAQAEMTFALGNGHLYTRGTLEESFLFPQLTQQEGTWVKGFSEELPNGKAISFALNGEWCGEEWEGLQEHVRMLDLSKGMLTRTFTWHPRSGGEVRVMLERLVSFTSPEILAIRCTLDLSGCTGDLRFEGYLTPPADPGYTMELLTVEEVPLLCCRTLHNGLSLYCTQLFQTGAGEVLTDQVRLGELMTLIATNSRKVADDGRHTFEIFNYYGHPFRDLAEQNTKAVAVLQKAASLGFDELKIRQQHWLNNYWEKNGVPLEKDALKRQAWRFTLFQHLFA